MIKSNHPVFGVSYKTYGISSNNEGYQSFLVVGCTELYGKSSKDQFRCKCTYTKKNSLTETKNKSLIAISLQKKSREKYKTVFYRRKVGVPFNP